jgi:dipeptidyl aminopeptidase/acylaminoacyl peptidase
VLRRNWPGDVATRLPGFSAGVRCVVDNFGPVDFLRMERMAQEGFNQKMWNGTATLPPSCTSSSTNPFCTASPVYFVTPKSAQMLVVHGVDDRIIPLVQASEMIAALAANQLPAEFLSYTGGHEFKGMTSDEIAAVLDQEQAYLVSILHP